MDVSPQLLREVEFREQWRGYSPDEVDDFLERLAVALAELQERLRDTTERAVRAERRLLDGDDDELRRTLVLAQRTADAAVEEAQAEAARLVADAEERARAVVAEAEARADAELGVLSERRSALEADVEALGAYVAEQRARLQQQLREQLAWLDRDHLAVPPPPAVSAGAGVVAHDVGDQGVGDDIVDLADAEAEADEHALDDLPVDADVRDAEGDAEGGPEVRDAEGDAEHEDDPFLQELRRAVDDDEPLGPREPEPRADVTSSAPDGPPLAVGDDTGEHLFDQDLAPARGFRRRRRR